MNEIFRLTVRHGTSPGIELERQHEVAGYTGPEEFIVCFPGGRATEVERVIHDLDGHTTYALLRGVLYEDPETYVTDLKYLREHGWMDSTRDALRV